MDGYEDLQTGIDQQGIGHMVAHRLAPIAGAGRIFERITTLRALLHSDVSPRFVSDSQYHIAAAKMQAGSPRPTFRPGISACHARTEERRVGKRVAVRVDLGGSRTSQKKK